MKMTKTLIVALLAGVVLQQLALSQTHATDANATAAGSAATNTTAGGSAEGAMAGDAAPSAAPAAVTASNESAGVTAEAGSNEMASAMAMSNAASGVAATNATAEATATNAQTAELPIQFQDVPITTAIESLARLAGINYLLDPKIGYGQHGPNGQPNPEPVLSVRWEHVTARQALLALLDNYGLQLEENPDTGIAKITIKPPNALPPLITRVVQLKYASTSNMVAAIDSLLLSDTTRRSRVVPDARTSQLVVVASETQQAQVDTLISNLDKPTRQVLIETKLVELSSNPSTEKGVDWSGTLQAQNVAFGNGVLSGNSSTTIQPTTTPAATSPSGATVGGGTTATTSSTITTLNSLIGNGGFGASTASGLLPDTGFLTADGVKAVLSFLNQSKEAQVMSTPHVVTLDNETATISVTRSFPIINVTAGTQVAAGGSTITYSNIGTILEVTPRITANNYIWLKVTPEVSSFFGKDVENVGGGAAGSQTISADIFDQRRINTQVLIPNGHTLVMGGLVQDNPNASYTKVPILGDIPILGAAFRSETKSMTKDNLMIFITPTILTDTDFQAATTDFLQSKPRTMKDPMNMHSVWDSAQPRGDWSNPLPEQENATPNVSGQGTGSQNVSSPSPSSQAASSSQATSSPSSGAQSTSVQIQSSPSAGAQTASYSDTGFAK
jgi:type II secretory pathway component GspD/PulD (secretin)